MGIPGLWAELAPAAQTTTLPSYCLTTFVGNKNELRGLRLGIDASLWLFHAQQSSGGANPYLRLLFYRLAKLLSLPVLPLFVFDGPSRPTWKRGKQVQGREHAIEQPFTQLIEAFGYQWRRAPGEAEAELAYLNQAGFVDAVLTDDSDALLFGTQVLIRNWGKNLSGTKALSRTTSTSSDVFEDGSHEAPATASTSKVQLSGSDRDHLITLYNAVDLAGDDMGIDRDGLILIALMSGGDYDTTGLLNCGVKIALALARGGFGTTLIHAFKRSYPDQGSASKSCPTFASFLATWLEEVREELRTNERGFLPSRRPKLASTIEDHFLSTKESRMVLAFYVYPLTSKSDSKTVDLVQKLAGPDLGRLARLSQIYFNWSKEAILGKFRTILGPGVVVRRLRQEVLEHNGGADEGPWGALVESPASKSVRRHMLGLDAGTTSNTTAASVGPKKQRPLHESPNATRITDFFAKTALASAPADPVFEPSGSHTSQMRSVDILAIKMQRRHAALDPFLDFRVLMSMEEHARAAEAGIDPRLDAELAASRALHDGSYTDTPDIDEEENFRRKPGTAKPSPDAPLLMWIPEPLLRLSYSGASLLTAFLQEVERKAAASKAKKAPKSKSGQMTLTSFVRPTKPSLAQKLTMGKSFAAAAPVSSFAAPAPAPSFTAAAAAPSDTVGSSASRTPRQLLVPTGLQKRGMRRTESVPVATGGLGTRKGLDRHISLPTTADPEVDEMDSSIEFLGSFVSSVRASAGDVHERSSTPPPTSDSDAASGRHTKSPKKLRASPTRRKTSSQRALAEPDSDDERETAMNAPKFGASLARSVGPSRPRTSAITISDSSDDEP
ncbi:XPG N-terminal [Kalmanozyma brasiliensis GHG001]|uniref:XPG-I domain-containing protein n=1 Tax=Kalmanozyma brasiliensis (strain GHG001) TaxID=1365824 RepID=V5E4N9_KALBG|nr:XPG N-terminal [Kalmanozyma brasiliensis GHG001]EST05156.1 XPG N-terminal [Kalmanozyma brasiliensis GHG001]